MGPNAPRIIEVGSKTALIRSRLPGLSYALNPYHGCTHGCLYCYAPAILHLPETECAAWGQSVGVKRSFPAVLAGELKRLKKRGRLQLKDPIGLGTVTDCYQPVEEQFQVTKYSLEVLARYDVPVSIQTKSALILRDRELLQRFTIKDIGFTLTTMDEHTSEVFEPGASSVTKRLKALTTLSQQGIDTWVFIAPLLPGFIDQEEELEHIVRAIRDAGARLVMADRFRLKPGLWERFEPVLLKNFPDRAGVLQEAIFGASNIFQKLETDLITLCHDYGLEYRPGFD